MIAVIFEVWPAEGRRESYLALAAHLKAELQTVPGFLSVERFESLTEPGKLLSLSFFAEGAAVRDWRNRAAHRQAQTAGRSGTFANYRLRVGTVIRDYGLNERAEAPGDSRDAHPA